MNLTRNHLEALCLTILLGFLTLISSAEAQTGSHLDLDFQRVPWTHLSFYGKNFWVEVSTDIQLRSLAASELDAILLTPPQGTPVKPQTSPAAELTINTIIDPRFRSPVKIYNRIWFNPSDAAALGRIRLRQGDDDFKKIYRFTDQGVFRHRMEPKSKREASLAPEKWTDVNNSFYPYDLTRLGCSGASERSLFIYILSAAAFSMRNDSRSLCVFGKRQLHHVKLQTDGIYPLKVNYTEKRQQETIRKEGIVKALKITLTSEPMESDLKKPENFSFLGFREDISIYIDPATHLPLQVNGIIPTVGKVSLKLHKAHVKR